MFLLFSAPPRAMQHGVSVKRSASSCSVKINTFIPGSPQEDPRRAGLLWSFLLPGVLTERSGFARDLMVPVCCLCLGKSLVSKVWGKCVLGAWADAEQSIFR